MAESKTLGATVLSNKGLAATHAAENPQSERCMQKAMAAYLLHAEIDQLIASIAKPTVETADLTQAAAEPDAAMAKAA